MVNKNEALRNPVEEYEAKVYRYNMVMVNMLLQHANGFRLDTDKYADILLGLVDGLSPGHESVDMLSQGIQRKYMRPSLAQARKLSSA